MIPSAERRIVPSAHEEPGVSERFVGRDVQGQKRGGVGRSREGFGGGLKGDPEFGFGVGEEGLNRDGVVVEGLEGGLTGDRVAVEGLERDLMGLMGVELVVVVEEGVNAKGSRDKEGLGELEWEALEA